MQGVWDAATPVLNPPSSPAGPPQPEPTPLFETDRRLWEVVGRLWEVVEQVPRPARARRSRAISPSRKREPGQSARTGGARRIAAPVQERASPPPPQGAAYDGPDPLGPPAPAPSLPASLAPDFDWSPLLLSMLMASASFALLLFLLTAAPRHSLARVSYQLAERRYDLGLIGVAMFMGLAFGYLVAIWIG